MLEKNQTFDQPGVNEQYTWYDNLSEMYLCLAICIDLYCSGLTNGEDCSIQTLV